MDDVENSLEFSVNFRVYLYSSSGMLFKKKKNYVCHECHLDDGIWSLICVMFVFFVQKLSCFLYVSEASVEIGYLEVL